MYSSTVATRGMLRRDVAIAGELYPVLATVCCGVHCWHLYLCKRLGALLDSTASLEMTVKSKVKLPAPVVCASLVELGFGVHDLL